VGAQVVTVARRFADLIVERFSQVDDVDGHPEIETALVELYRATGHAPYLETARCFLERRGHGLLGDGQFGSAYFQDHEPVRAATEFIGHAVRQLYLLAGAVAVAEGLAGPVFQGGEVALDLFEQTRRFGTGGEVLAASVGRDGESRRHGEAEPGHLGQICAFAAEQGPEIPVAFGEVVHVYGRGHRSP
jgi:hypothetical protein